MITTIKRAKTGVTLSIDMKEVSMGKLLSMLQALKNYNSPVAHDVYCSIRNGMYSSDVLETKEALKTFEDSQK